MNKQSIFNLYIVFVNVAVWYLIITKFRLAKKVLKLHEENTILRKKLCDKQSEKSD